MKRTSFLLVVFLLLCIGVFAQQKRAMTFEDVLAIKSVSDAQVSPDGKWIAYVVTSVDMKENANDADVWLVSTAGGDSIRLTTSKKNDNQPRWSPDGKKIAFISAREEKPQIFLISPFGGEAEKLTDSKSGVQSFQWAPDGNRIAYVAQLEPTPDEEKKTKDKDDAQVIDKNFKFTRISVIDLNSKKTRELVKGEYSASDPQWSPNGRLVAFVTNPTPKADDGSSSDIWVIDVESGTQRKLIENDGPDSSPRWSPDGRQIALSSRDLKNGEIGQQRLMIVSTEGGTPREVASNLLYQPGPSKWSVDGRTLYFNAGVRTTSQVFSVPSAGGEAKQISNIAGVIGQATFSRDGSVIAFTKSDTQHADDVYVAKALPIGEPLKLTDHNPQVRDLALGSSEVVRWKGKDGMEIEGIVIYPVGYQQGKRYPTIALIHGGPSGAWTQSFPNSWGNFGHVWAGKGWVAFYPNIRGSSSYGEKFMLSNVRDWGGGDYQDIQTGLDQLIAKGMADPDKLGQAGWSYGGLSSIECRIASLMPDSIFLEAHPVMNRLTDTLSASQPVIVVESVVDATVES
jgi:dipeptidyl aminopeptidase/acylaminoacyl peptidase